MEPPRLGLTLHFVSSSKMSRASGKERASRSSLVATNVLAARQAASASEDPAGPDLCRSGRGRNVGAIVAEAERVQGRRAERWDLAALLRRGRIPRSSSCRARTSGDGRGPPRDAQKGRFTEWANHLWRTHSATTAEPVYADASRADAARDDLPTLLEQCRLRSGGGS
jgi:hypothetical protein